jgi:hypothetical protein
MKGSDMTTDETAQGGNETGPLPFDNTKAHHARVYDYLLGGKDNYAADRAAAEETLKVWPEFGFAARANRAFLGRVIRYLAREAGIRQFLDIGTGIPTAGSTHQVAQESAAGSRVVYVDYDPIVLAHARALLRSEEPGSTEYIHADVRDTGTILSQASQVLDFTQPVAVTLVAILHAIPDPDDPHAIVAMLMDAVPRGSFLALSHGGWDLLDQEARKGFDDIMSRMAQQTFTLRDRVQVARFFDGLDLVEPGLVPIEQWRPDPSTDDTRKSSLWGAVGRKK